MRDTPHTTRVAFVVAMLVLVVAMPVAATGFAAAQSDGNGTQTPGTAERKALQQDEGLTLQELRKAGTQASTQAPAGVRMLDETGAVAITYNPAQPFSKSRKFLAPGTTLNTDDITVYSTRFGENIEPRTVMLHIAYYAVGEKTRTAKNGQTVTKTVAKNVTHQKVKVTLGTGYSMANVSLVPHYGQKVHMSMWMTETDGDSIEGVRWTNLKQRSDPASASAGIEDKGDLWNYVLVNAFGVGMLGLLGGFGTGKHVLNKIGKGPDLGLFMYGIMGAFGMFAIGAFAYMYASAVLANIPVVWGLLIGLVGFLGYLEVGGPPNRKFLFEQDVLTDATSPRAEDVKDTVYEEVKQVTGIRREDGKIGLPAKGIRPAIARYFAEPATLDELDVETRVDLGGDFDEKFIADPESDEVLVHTPARLAWNPTLIENRSTQPPGGLAAVTDLFERVNWTFILGSVAFVGGGWLAGSAVLGFPMVGAFVGLLGVYALGVEAKDGEASFEPAPVHYRKAKGTVLNLAQQYDDAKTIEEAERKRYEAEATTANEMRRREANRSQAVSMRLAEESVGVSFDETQGSDKVPRPEDGRDRSRRRREQKATSNGHDARDEDDEDDEESGWRDA